MLNTLSQFISKHNLIADDDKLLLAVSGGKDSVCMAHLFSELPYEFGIAHCNFKLRGEDSDLDEQFVRNLSKDLGVEFYSKSFETKLYAKKNSLSIQMAARDLRYQFFNETVQEYNYTKIVTAHHSEDILETLLIKKSRKSSVGALQGIPIKNGNIIRPMLDFSVQQIEGFIKEQSIEFRLDKSNLSLDYQRNRIRHEIMPDLSKSDLLDEIEANKRKYARLLKEVEYYLEHHTFEKESVKFFEIGRLNTLNNKEEVLYECLKHYGPFNWKDVFSLLKGEVGKKVLNSVYRIVKERNALCLSLIPSNPDVSIQLNEDTRKVDEPISLKIDVYDYSSFDFKKDSKISILDYDKLHFPLTLRKWKHGDVFIPLGMKGRKKISDYLIDEKLSSVQKENTWVICSLDDIVCVLGERINESYKLVAETEKVYLVQPLKNQT
ncbi:MAG: tRNA lysidine(34) synthetase TilS [Flavobacteriales bacterium]|nr:tRNA lysidine(34) synthetase TilS [Flavobacteriales bacterium]MBL6872923.1 tRNA lysidine(34) synthetase TilS [Flavobacteriales bacterium]